MPDARRLETLECRRDLTVFRRVSRDRVAPLSMPQRRPDSARFHE